MVQRGPRMKPYRDLFGNPLAKQDVSMAVQAAVMTDKISAFTLSRATGLAVGKAGKILRLLEDAKVITPAVNEQGIYRVILKGFNNHAAAVNAAFRQLKKGRV